MLSFAASFDEQLSPVAPFLFYIVIAGIIFIETGLLSLRNPVNILICKSGILVVA